MPERAFFGLNGLVGAGVAWRCNEILPNFDQRMRQPAARPMGVERVAFQSAAVGHVFADDKIVLGVQCGEQR